MKIKKITFIILTIIIKFSMLFSLDYDASIPVARQLIKEEKYEEAEEIIQNLYDEYKTEESLLILTDIIAWQGDINKSIKLLLDQETKSDNIQLNLAKYYYWNGDYKKAHLLYQELEEKGIDTGENAVNAEKAYFIQDSFKKFGLKFTYFGDFQSDNKEEIPTLEFKYDNQKIAFIYTREHFTLDSNNWNTSNTGEIYYKNFIFTLGNSDVMNYTIALDYGIKNFIIGLKYNNYDNDEIYGLKLQLNLYFKHLIFMQNATLLDNSDHYYKTRLKYKRLHFTQYYNFKNSNKSELIFRRDVWDNIGGEIGFYRDFERNSNGIIVGLQLKF